MIGISPNYYGVALMKNLHFLIFIIVLATLTYACGDNKISSPTFNHEKKSKPSSSNDSPPTSVGEGKGLVDEWIDCKRSCDNLPKVIGDFFGGWECKVNSFTQLGSSKKDAMQRLCCSEFITSRYAKSDVKCQERQGLPKVR